MRLVVDTGVFSAALSRRRRPEFEAPVARLVGNQLFLAAQTLAELRYGALVAGWGKPRTTRLESAIGSATVIPVSDELIAEVARLRYRCRTIGHGLADRAHRSDLWIAAAAVHIGRRLVAVDGIFDDVPGLTLG